PGDVLAIIDERAAAAPAAPEREREEEKKEEPRPEKRAAAPQAQEDTVRERPAAPERVERKESPPLSPAVKRLVKEHDLDPAAIAGSGKDGRILKGDVLDYLNRKEETPATPAPATAPSPAPATPRPPTPERDAAREERVKMSRLRLTIAKRLKEAQNTAAMLTTFNEADMTEVMEVRRRFKDVFMEKHGVKLGFMSFFVRAVTIALKDIPALNAEIDGDEIVYKNYYHIGIAVGTDRGLVVPVVRDADTLSLADIEKAIADFAERARSGRLKLEDMMGGTFSITNGGVYGSLMSTPILNTPQSGILGMHKIQQRPVVMDDGSIAARPMMYLALSYDHRIVDGKEAVTFLVRVKEVLEDPRRLILDL
ncbi:MAG TPA: 2-oxoglutarate dehydrogenase complex dihydrolipoyllysine-residue succinyltransferase, partial [Thermopetrobacter sp.]|nr:2-oxoglutarate dehydrogenase complex dihydrolipoyllysine-residue succinyltransferase [Thermopetrobacter sp.]